MTKTKHFSVLFLLLLFVATTMTAQSVRYRDPVFNLVKVTKGVKYGSAKNYLGLTESLNMDIYEPMGDNLAKRPVVVIMFGGAFLIGHRGMTDMVALAENLAKHGYVVASIDYRLGFTIGSQRSAIRAVYRAVQDVRAAIRFLHYNRNVYKLNMDRLFVGGESAGSISAIHTAFMDTDAKRPTETRSAAWYIPENSDMGCLDCSGNTISASFNVKGIVNIWGAIYNTAFIEPRHNTPMVSIHGEDDIIVSINSAPPFSATYLLPTLHGSRPITNRLNTLGVYNEFYPYPKQGHVFYGVPDLTFPNEYWPPVFRQAKNFLYTIMQRLNAAGVPIMQEETTDVLEESNPVDLNPSVKETPKMELKTVTNRQQNIDISADASHTEEVMIVLYDLSGRIVHQSKQSLNEGNNQFSVELSEATPAGVYILQMKSATQTLAHKFLVR